MYIFRLINVIYNFMYIYIFIFLKDTSYYIILDLSMVTVVKLPFYLTSTVRLSSQLMAQEKPSLMKR